MIPFAHGQRLFAAAGQPKRFVSVKGGHEDAYRADTDVYYGAIDGLLKQVEPGHGLSGGAAKSSGASQ